MIPFLASLTWQYHKIITITATHTPISTIRDKQTYFLLAFFWCSAAQLRFYRAQWAFLQVSKSSSPMMSIFAPCSQVRVPVSLMMLWTFMRVFDTLWSSSLLYRIILCSNSQESPRASSLCSYRLPPQVLVLSSLSLWPKWVQTLLSKLSLLLASCLFLGRTSLSMLQKVVICESLILEGVSLNSSQKEADANSCFLLSFWIRNCCLTVPIFLAVSGSRQDCSSFSISSSIFDMLVSMMLFSRLILSAMLAFG